jgi:phosphate transport system permease protein
MNTKTDIPEALRRKFRPSDWIAAQSIRLVAVLSLLTILLIFVFVAKESLPVFTGQARAGHEALSAKTNAAPSGETSESYGDAPATSEAPASYGDAPAAATPAAPASYGDEPAATPAPSADAPKAAATTAAAPAADDPYGTPSMTPDAAPASDEPPTPAAKPFHFLDLFSFHWDPVSTVQPSFGIWPLIMGSLKVTLIALLFGAPVGILAALYTTTFAPKWAKEILKPVIEILAGIPSVVVGFFALMILASLLQSVFGMEYRLNAIVGGLALSLCVIPIIYTLSEDAINAVPKYLTEGSLALGATKWETNFIVVLPAATPGIFAALLLGLGRAFGETMIVLMATGNAALMDSVLTNPVRTLSASIGAEMAEVVQGDLHYSVLFFLGIVLFAFSFALNAIAEFYVRARLMKRFKGI